MGNAAEVCARECGVPREAQDEWAIRSYKRAQESQKSGRFDREIIGVEVPRAKGEPVTVTVDEDPVHTDFGKIPKLKPAFSKEGTVTAANSSKISDGAAALVVMSRDRAQKLGTKPLARIISFASSAKDPLWFTTAPADAIPLALKKANLKVSDIDLFEVNEAFAVVAIDGAIIFEHFECRAIGASHELDSIRLAYQRGERSHAK